MNIFVTGATGFVGSHLTEALLAKGHSVRILVRSENKLATVFGEGFADRPDVTIVRGSLTDINSLEEGCR
ncbi:MAG: NAD(P)H-binding protein, partial [Gemmatimonadota bacterium]|nr:NAD(P)H-binding protein [Gemmatimonadota bacterium]